MISLGLDDLIEQAKARKVVADAKKAQEEKDRAEKALASFRAAMGEAIPEEIQREIGLSCFVENHSGTYHGYASLSTPLGGHYKIVDERHYSDLHWSIYKALSLIDNKLRNADLLDRLLLLIADDAEAERDYQRREQERRAKQAKMDAEYAKKQAEREEARHLLIAGLDADHARLEAYINEETERQKAAAWQWPEGREITIYRWSWCVGGDGQGNCEFDDGWALTDHFDRLGYVTFMPERYRSRERTICLIPEAHHPVVERLLVSGIKDLSADLLIPHDIDIPGIKFGYCVEASDSKKRLMDDPEYTYRSATIVLPLDWIQKLVDEQR